MFRNSSEFNMAAHRDTSVKKQWIVGVTNETTNTEYTIKLIIFGILHTENSISLFILPIRAKDINYMYVSENKIIRLTVSLKGAASVANVVWRRIQNGRRDN
jgi:hypothetical protein